MQDVGSIYHFLQKISIRNKGMLEGGGLLQEVYTSSQSKFMMCSHPGYEQLTVYFERFGFGILSMQPHISHWILRVSGALGPVGSSNVRPTSLDQPNESEYLSAFTFNFFCFKERRILRLRFPFFFPGGVLAAMGIMQRWVLMYSMTSLG